MANCMEENKENKEEEEKKSERRVAYYNLSSIDTHARFLLCGKFVSFIPSRESAPIFTSFQPDIDRFEGIKIASNWIRESRESR